MRGLILLLVVAIVTVDTVRSQARPPTRTRKGPPPSRRGRPGDNTDVGMPSGKDVPDGRRFAPPPAAGPPPVAAAPPAAGPPPPAAPPAGAGPPPAAGGPPPALPPTRTRSRGAAGAPRRPGDNTDRGLPSGKDVPDGRRFAPAPAAAGPPVAGPPAAAAAVSDIPPRRVAHPPVLGARAPPARSGPPPAAGGVPPTRTRTGTRPARRFNDNPDFGLPSGRDWPDARRYFAPAPPAFFPPSPFYPPQPAMAPPQMACDRCDLAGWNPVCSVTGATYDNNCYLQCSGEARNCDGPCPCESGPPAGFGCSQCRFEDFNPVCTEDGEQLRNECEATCRGEKIMCSSHCPC